MFRPRRQASQRCTAIEIIRLVLGHGEDLKNENIVAIIGFGLAGWTYIYVVMQETHKRFFGLSETLVGFVLMAVQLYDLPEKLAKPDIGLRITAILGSVGLLAKGMQDLIKSSEIKKKSDPKR